MSRKVESWREPLFDDLLRGIRLRSTLYFRPELRAPWGVRIERNCAVFHIVTGGRCRLELEDKAPPVPLTAGDFVIVTRGGRHSLRSMASSTLVDFFELAERQGPDRNRLFRAGGQGALTRLVCGGMQFEGARGNPLLAILPPLLHVKASEGRVQSSLRLTVEHVVEELDSGRAGAVEVVTRLADVLFIQAVRAYFAENADSAKAGWLAAVRDQQIGQVLAWLHASPHEPWTVSSLAGRLGVSRSGLAARFKELVGEPPLQYLMRLRINAAAERLVLSDDKLSRVAASAGYESAASFVRSFKRHMGETPGEYRAKNRFPQS